ncbi:nhypothetical protein [Blastocystis sp. subtype 4]|uniref:nhypothetical protein n=1 Tax=Blastocystis sp. subtype 4 TaxID=944170 RepID=UPI000711C259|nr:nhypothetical protein [Blastocystis sp. subtype 4]KNB42528.1 nhypothetical protein [Blastocystis sp. subtype 4]|eukprot:XP_014525971.1 nhypothetical protein [Blastocystis sp. subtype 4]
MSVRTVLFYDFLGDYRLEPVVELINSKIHRLGFAIREISCDDGEYYYCYVNTVVDAIAKKSSLPEGYTKLNIFNSSYLSQLRDLLTQMEQDDVIDPTSLFQGGKEDVVQYFFDHNWLIRYSTENGTTVIGGPRLLAEMGNWLIREVGYPECPVCMDPVVGGLSCPHACGARLHHSCAYRTLMSMESNNDGTEKGVCPNCKEKWSLDLNSLTDHGRIYRRENSSQERE